MTRIQVQPEQAFYDEHTLIAQRYAGALTGHNYRADQQRPSLPEHLHIDAAPWKEPVVFADDCDFCKRGLSDEQVIARVLGYQAQIDIEVMRGKDRFYREWLQNPANLDRFTDLEDVPIWEPDPEAPGRRIAVGTRTVGKYNSHPNRRTYIVLTQDVARPNRPNGWKTRPFPMVDLPLRLKRKLCIEWNHLYRDYLAKHENYHYDFETKDFYRDVDPPDACPSCGGEGLLTANGHPTWLHIPACDSAAAEAQNRVRNWYQQADDIERSLYHAYFGGTPDNPLAGPGDTVGRWEED